MESLGLEANYCRKVLCGVWQMEARVTSITVIYIGNEARMAVEKRMCSRVREMLTWTGREHDVNLVK